MISLHSPFRPWEKDHGRVFLDFLGTAGEAYLQYRANKESWEYAKDIPDKQAEANKKVIEKTDNIAKRNSKKQREIIQNAINDYLYAISEIADKLDDAYPTVPKAAEYVPVDVCCEQGNTIECNISHTDRADAYVRYVNRLHEQNDLVHLLSMCPDFLVNLDTMNNSIQEMLRGTLPVGDVVEVLTDNAEMASLYGRIGSTKKTTARDLGISKLRIQAAGREEMRRQVEWMNSSVSSRERQLSIREMMLSPANRVDWALVQAQLIQNSLQNKNNMLAQKNPAKLARVQLRLQRQITKLQAKSSKALLINTYIPNFALTTPSPVGPDPGQKTLGLSNFVGAMGKIGDKIDPALRNWFYGGWGASQDGAQPGYDQSSEY